MTTAKAIEKVEKIAEWVALTYGVEAIKEMATDAGFVKYMDAYNEAMFVFLAKLKADKDAMAILAEQVYTQIRQSA